MKWRKISIYTKPRVRIRRVLRVFHCDLNNVYSYKCTFINTCSFSVSLNQYIYAHFCSIDMLVSNVFHLLLYPHVCRLVHIIHTHTQSYLKCWSLSLIYMRCRQFLHAYMHTNHTSIQIRACCYRVPATPEMTMCIMLS